MSKASAIAGLRLGNSCPLDRRNQMQSFVLPSHHLTTHGFICGMTNTGKTGAAFGVVEEVLREGIPVLMIDLKGDLPNLALAFPSFDASHFEPWVEPPPGDARSVREVATALAAERQNALQLWGLHEPDLRAFHDGVDVRILTPGSDAGEPVHVLSSLEHALDYYREDPSATRASLTAAISLVLRLVGLDADPTKSRRHVLLSVLAEHQLKSGLPCDLVTLLGALLEPPIDTVGALPLDTFISSAERQALAAKLNTLLASPSFASWRSGTPLDIAEWLAPKNGRTQAVIVSVAHLDDEERELVLGILFEELLTWVRKQRGTKYLRALVFFDEVYGYVPPHPQNPPSKQPILTLMKQGRAHGVGVILATQNPMDVDYRALSNAGFWCIGRLQTNADRTRVLEGLAQATGASAESRAALERLCKNLYPRWFILRDVRSKRGTLLFQPRWAMSYLRGPMTPSEIRLVRQMQAARRAPKSHVHPSLPQSVEL